MPIFGAGRPSRRSGAHPRRSRRTRRAGPARCGRHSRPSLHAPCSSRSGCPLPARRLAIFRPPFFDQLHRRPLPLLARVARETAPGRRPEPSHRRAGPRRHRAPGPAAAQARDLPSADAATSTCPIPSPVSAIRVPAVTVQSRLRTAATSTPPRRKVRSPPAHRTRTVSGAAAAGCLRGHGAAPVSPEHLPVAKVHDPVGDGRHGRAVAGRNDRHLRLVVVTSSSRTSSSVAESSSPVGSSVSTTAGSTASATARPARAALLPDSAPG
jgi:hypothetical protein